MVLLGLGALGTSRLNACIRTVAAQGIVLGILILAIHIDELTPRLAGLAALTVALKGFVIPLLLFRSIREAGVRREVEPYVGFGASIVLGAVAVGASFALASVLELPSEAPSRLIAPVSLATLFIGLLLLTTRKKAITQAVGYLVLENGIFVFSLALVTAIPTLVEMGVLLDVFVGAFVMGITIHHINQEFDHIDAYKLQALHDLSPVRARRVSAHGRRHRDGVAAEQAGQR
jgi:hydrogenase-4 component E